MVCPSHRQVDLISSINPMQVLLQRASSSIQVVGLTVGYRDGAALGGLEGTVVVGGSVGLGVGLMVGNGVGSGLGSLVG